MLPSRSVLQMSAPASDSRRTASAAGWPYRLGPTLTTATLGRSSASHGAPLDPAIAEDLGKDYILVCTSTDPAWTPLFINAAGLVPASLLRWELTGRQPDDVQRMLN